MIPRILTLHNFLSYRDATVDFRGLSFVVLAGKNGQGKSALIDAMTWALWKKARGKTVDAPITLGTDEMRVEFEFEVDDTVYVVIRKLTRGKGAKVDLFQVREDGTRMELSGGINRETDVEIVRRVGMDFDTFESSALLAQGRADEFTRNKSAADRKEVLRGVLGLERYERLSVRAKEDQKVAAGEMRRAEAQLGEAGEELKELPGLKTRHTELAVERDKTAVATAKVQDEVDTLRAAANARQERLRAVEATQGQVAAARKRISESEAEIARLADEGKRLEELLADRETVETRFARLIALREEEVGLAAKALQASNIAAEQAQVSGQVGEVRATLETQAAGLERHVAEARAKADRREQIVAAQSALGPERARIEALRVKGGKAETEAAEASGRASTEQGRIEGIKARGTEVNRTLKQLEGLDAKCPVCERPVDAAERARLQQQFQEERARLVEELNVSKANVETASREAGDRSATAKRLRVKADAADRDLHRREAALQAELAETEAAREALPALEQQHSAIAKQLADGDYAAEARARLAELGAELEAVAYDGAAHAAVREEMAELAPVEQRRGEIAEAATRLEGLAARRTDREASRNEAAADLATFVTAQTEAEAALAATEDVSAKLAAAEDELRACRDRLSTIDRDLGSAAARIENLEHRAAQVEVIRDQLAAHQEEASLSADLASAFGRDGVQAMLIDQAIPEIERVANEMLDRMTGGRIQVRLVTLTETKSGDSRGTLDFRISDELGTRPYELYSGGEAFRVDFALRLALSHVLAARAGTSLPTLIIDEGFGTQDQEGIDRLMEALNRVRNDYRLILVVTHIEELKERFEERIEVSKDADRGSQAVIV